MLLAARFEAFHTSPKRKRGSQLQPSLTLRACIRLGREEYNSCRSPKSIHQRKRINMILVLVRKLLRDIRVAWIVIAILLFLFQILWSRIAQRTTDIIGEFNVMGID